MLQILGSPLLHDLTDVAAVATFVILIFQVSTGVWTYRKEQVRARKHATYVAYSEVRDRILEVQYGKVQPLGTPTASAINADHRLRAEVIVMLSRIERFAVAIEEGVFDFGMVSKISRTSLVSTFEDLREFILNERKAIPEYGTAFERLAERLMDRKAILARLAEGPMTQGQLAAATQSTSGFVRRLLGDMRRDGEIKRMFGEYRLPPTEE